MTNPYLFRSSLICGVFVISAAFLIDTDKLLCSNAIHGVASSLANHYWTNDFYKKYDRLAMVIGFLINAYFIIKNKSFDCAFLILLAASLYFVAKKVKSDKLHAGAHVAISACMILLFLKSSSAN